MNIHPIAALAALLIAFGSTSVSHAQIGGGKSDPSIKTPADPGMNTMPDKSMKAPSNSGIVVVPPKTGTADAMVTTPPRRIDPKIDDATPGIDKKNSEKSQEKNAK